MSRRLFLKRAAAGFSAVAAATTIGGIILSRGRPAIEFLYIRHPDLPLTFDGLRILQLSDFHAGPYMSRDDLMRIRELAEKLKPDVFVLTGDFADSNPDEVPIFVSALQNLHGKLATYSILGNHDYYAGIGEVEAGLQAANLNLLRNSHRVIESGGDKIAFVGLDDRWAKRWGLGRGPDFEMATKNIDDRAFKICLSHQPQLWPECVRRGMHITLAGHTHGGQIAIPSPQFNLARLISPYVAGFYKSGKQLLYVNRGLGTVGVPLRIGVPPEITLITLRRGPLSYA